MSSNAPWGNQFESDYSGKSKQQTDSSGNWNRPAVNTPQTNPASWPQLGAASSEQTNQPSAISVVQQPAPTSEESSWTSAMSNTVASSKSDQGGTSAWGKPSASSGWGAPSTGGAWGKPHSSGVDDGTAVWEKSASAQQHQGGWGGQTHVTQGNESTSAASGWGVSEPTSTNNQDGNSTPNSQQSITSTQASVSNQPVSWAKAASAGLPPSTTKTETTPPVEVEPETVEAPAAATPQPPMETDPVKKLVNSHEGWGKKPIQQGTSWNISEPSQKMCRPQPTVNNGTEAWGKPTGGQMPPTPSWNNSSVNKQPSNWNANYNAPPAPSGGNWSGPTQPQPPRPSFMPGNTGNTPGWGNSSQQPQSGGNNGGWNDMPSQPPNNPSNWNGPPIPQNISANPGWGAMPSNNENNSSPSWGDAPPGRSGPQGPAWGNNMMQQPNTADQSAWGRSADSRRHSTVDDGTSAWGDPGTYSKVNMWDQTKAGMANAESVGGQMPKVNSQIEPKGWGAPPNQPSNKPPSPKGWGDMSSTRPNPAIDNNTSGWGPKNVSGDKWDKGNGSWNSAKQNSGNWGSNDQQWGSSDNGSNWGPQMGKSDTMKNNVDYGPKGAMLMQPNMNQQMMMRNNQMPPVLPLQLQSQFNQIRQAVMSGLLPKQILNPQMMTPQNMHIIMQFINKNAELEKMLKALPQMQRLHQVEQFTRLIRQCQQQIEAQKALIIQNLQQPNLNKPQPNLGNSMNPSTGGIDLVGGRTGPGRQSMMSPLNNMGAMSQALPSTSLPTLASSAREPASRFMNKFMNKQPNNFGGMGENPSQPNPSNLGMNMVGPAGDPGYNGMPYRAHPDEAGMPDNAGIPSAGGPLGDRPASQLPNSNDPSVALADIGPPEFTPGVPWKGFRHIDPESDPNITPGSVAIAKTMSINTVRDADQVLTRDRSAQPDVPPGTTEEANLSAQLQSNNNLPDSAPSRAWSTGANGTITGTSTGNAAAMPSNELWKGSSSNQSAFRSSNELAPPSWGEQQQASRGSWDQQSQQMQRGSQNANWNGGNSDNRGSWLVLTNCNQQVDPVYVQNMCAQHGNVMSFQPHYPMEGMILVKYRSPDEAINAKMAMNMFMVGSTMLVATVATDRDVSNFMTATGGSGSWASSPPSGNRFMSGTGSTGGFVTQPPPARPNMAGSMDANAMQPPRAGQQFWGNNAAPPGSSWSTNASSNLAWSGATEEMSRIMSPMHSLLPENLLGGETM